jgi:hypothetical protein
MVLGLVVGATMAGATTQASAHAHLHSSTPGENTTVASPQAITLHFTEALEARFSGFEITDAHNRRVNVTSHADPADAAVLVATLGSPLPAGVYHVNWHIVAHDGHRMRGAFEFTVAS